MFSLPPYYYFEVGALLISVVVLYRFNNPPLHWLIPFLVLMVGVETIGLYYQKSLHKSNIWLYNISIPIEYIFYGLLIGSLCLTRAFKKIILRLTALLAAWAVINVLFIQGHAILDTHTLKAGSICMIVFSCLGLVDLFRSDEHKTLLANPLFWISAGVLFFNAGEFTYLFFFDTFLQNGWDKAAKLFSSINNNLIYVLYTCISIAIICSKIPEKKT